MYCHSCYYHRYFYSAQYSFLLGKDKIIGLAALQVAQAPVALAKGFSPPARTSTVRGLGMRVFGGMCSTSRNLIWEVPKTRGIIRGGSPLLWKLPNYGKLGCVVLRGEWLFETIYHLSIKAITGGELPCRCLIQASYIPHVNSTRRQLRTYYWS